jgi:hypothetical protein
MKMARLSIIVKGSSYMLSSEASETTTSTQIALLITGPQRAPLFMTSSKIYSKRNFHFYVFAWGDRRLRHCGRRITTAGNGPYWLGMLRRP